MKDVKYSITHGSEPDIQSRYYNLDGEHYHLTQEEIIELGKDFLKWTQTIKKPYRAGKFFRKLGWGYDDIKQWKDKYPLFRKLYNEGKEELGDIRELGAAERKYDSGTINRTLHFYVQEYKEDQREDKEFESKLTQDNSKSVAGSQEYVFLQSFAEMEEKLKDNK